jgi:hypothetical protein
VDPAKVPRHRQWVYATKLIKGENTVFAGKGGWGKSACAVSVTCCAAAGRDLLGEKVWGGPKRVLYINSEDDVDELQRRFIAAYHHHGLTSAEIANILVRGVDSPGHQTLTTGDDNAAQLKEPGFTMLDQLIGEAEAEIVVLDPLGPFCPAGLNSNGVMGQVLLRLKRIARKHQCAILIVHHTRKDGDLTSTDAIGGASAIVNQARVALLVARMTTDEAKKFPGVLESELWRYIRIVDAKTNRAPPSSDTHWFRLVTHDLSNAEPPTYPTGDGVQVVEKVVLAQLSASPVSNTTDDAAKRAILQAAYQASPPFSPSARGGSDRYIVPKVLDAVRQATGLKWADRDLRKRVEALVNEMRGAGWLRVEEVKAHGNSRQGIIVDPARTPWAGDFADPVQSCRSAGADQIRQTPIEKIDTQGAGGIDAPRPTGASNVPMGSGDLMKPEFDAAAAAGKVSGSTMAQRERPSVASAAHVETLDRQGGAQRVAVAGPAAPPAAENCTPSSLPADPVTSTKNAPQAAAAADCREGADEQTPRTKNAPADSAAADDPALRVDAVVPVEPAPAAPKVATKAPTQNADDDLSIPEFLRRDNQPDQKRQAA